jgi:general secretion pathway protein D
VPGLGDIPGLGALFRTKGRENVRTNLMVFIRPTIIGGPDDAQRATAPRYDYMRDAQLQLELGDGNRREAALDVLVRDYLRTQPPVAPQAPSTAPAPAPAATAPITPPPAASPSP